MDEDEKKGVETEVSDTDADTADVEREDRDEYSGLSKRITAMEEAVNRMSGVVSAMQKAQSNVVNSGSVIRETQDDTDTVDEFGPIEKLDFTI